MAPSVRPSVDRRGALIVAGTILLACSLGRARAQLAPISATETQVPQMQSLRLEVYINGISTNLVEPFDLLPNRRLQARRASLEEAGIKVPAYQDPQSPIAIDSLKSVTYRFDEAHQSIDFHLPDSARIDRIYDAATSRLSASTPQSDWGSVLNYTIFGTTTSRIGALPHFSGVNASLDARAFSPYGEVSQTAIVGDTVGAKSMQLRLDTTYVYSDPTRVMTGRAGDVVSGALAWTRPIRIGGLQAQRDFGLRGDLVTQPLPNVSGSASVPSTIDVFVNNTKTYSQTVAPGPYSVTNIPVVSGDGTAHIVVTDASGRQTQSSLSFFTTPQLLAPGLNDFSLEMGFARRNYGLFSEDYDKHPLASATLRRGLNDWLTVEAHGEGGKQLAALGLGTVSRIGRWGVVSAAISGSRYRDQTGAQIYADYNFELRNIAVDVSSQRTLRSFNDLASVTTTTALSKNLVASGIYGYYSLDPRPPRSLNRITLSMPLRFDSASLSTSFIDLVQADGTKSRIVTASISRPLPFNASAFATGFFDLTRHGGSGFYAGLSIPLGSTMQASVGGSFAEGSRFGSIDVAKPIQRVDNSFGWRLRDTEGTNSIRTGDVAYRSPYATAEIFAAQVGRQVSTQGTLDGSVGVMNTGGFFAGNRIYDGFAVVDTGIADIPVYQDNRLIGTTNPFGKFVVSDLRSYQINTIGIDPLALPANADVPHTRTAVSTANRAGVGLNFGIDRNADAALLTLTDGNGRPLAVGSKGHIEGSQDSFVVGYDGQAYVKHLRADNRVLVDLGDRDCAASFAYTAGDKKMVTIGPIRCQ